MVIFTYAFHSKANVAIDKLHIIVKVYHKDPNGPVKQREDPAKGDYGSLVESECGLKGVLIKTDVEAMRSDDFEGMGLKHFRDKYGGIDTAYFFMPPFLRVSMPIAIAEGMIPDDRVCGKCRDNLEANIRNAKRGDSLISK
jgi:hypothetical protein